jgi:hypothetical protein
MTTATMSWHYRDVPGERSVKNATETLHVSIYAGEERLGRIEVPVVQLPWMGPNSVPGSIWWGPPGWEIVYEVPAAGSAITFTRLTCSPPREARERGFFDDIEIPADLPVTIEPGHSLTLNMANALVNAC